MTKWKYADNVNADCMRCGIDMWNMEKMEGHCYHSVHNEYICPDCYELQAGNRIHIHQTPLERPV